MGNLGEARRLIERACERGDHRIVAIKEKIEALPGRIDSIAADWD
jgi:hypothetical protein